MTLDEFIQEAKACKVGSGSVTLGERAYEYDIIPRNFEPSVPFFVGYPKGYLFISDEVPERFRKAVLAHEVKCRRLQDAGDMDHCQHAAAHELLYIPGEANAKEYFTMRLTMFEALVERYRKGGDKNFVRAITASRDQFRMLLADYL